MKIKYKIKIKRRGKIITQTKTKKVDISGKIISVLKRGIFSSRFGTKIHGIKIVYRKKLEYGAGRGGRIKTMTVSKIIPIPKDAFKVKITK